VQDDRRVNECCSDTGTDSLSLHLRGWAARARVGVVSSVRETRGDPTPRRNSTENTAPIAVNVNMIGTAPSDCDGSWMWPNTWSMAMLAVSRVPRRVVHRLALPLANHEEVAQPRQGLAQPRQGEEAPCADELFNLAIPSVARDFRATVTDAQWILNA
jgi:hypothetical protein